MNGNPLAVVAFGGNALLRREDHGTTAEQHRRAAEAAGWLVDLLEAGHDLLVLHGNGPQVGQVMIQMEEAATKTPPGSLDVAVAQTVGSMGYMLELALHNRLRRRGLSREVTTVLSRVVVDRGDPGFAKPTKPVGPFLSRYRASLLQRQHGWQMVEDAGRGWRRVVASPRPLEVLGLDAARALLAAGHVVIAGGGGGVPVIRHLDGTLEGVEAVIDKDYTAALVARELGAETLAILTAVPQVMENFGTEQARPLPRLTAERAEELLAAGQFPPGSMGPKIRATLEFVRATGHAAVITDDVHLGAALRGEAGTRVLPD